MPSLEELLNLVYSQTAPLREQTVNTLSAVLGGAPASSLPAYAPNRSAIEGQYNVALDQAYSGLPRGGQLNKAILDLGEARAGAVSDLESAVRGEALNKASSLGFGVVPGITTGLSAQQGLNLQQRMAEQQERMAGQQELNATVSNIGLSLGLLSAILGDWL